MEDFFEGVDQVDVRFNGGKGKLPIFYRDTRMLAGMFPANLLKIRQMLPDPRYSPAQVFPGVGILYLAAFEYRDVDIEPYNEFAIGAVLNSPYYMGIPGYNVLRQLIARFYNVYIHHLPVTTEIALRAGRDFYNFPKFIADIDFSDSNGSVTCDLSHDGDKILSLTGNKIPTRNFGDVLFTINLYQNGKPQQTEFRGNVSEGVLDWGPRNVSVQLGSSNPIAREISDALLAPNALMYLYHPKLEGILYGPQNLSMPLLSHAFKTAKLIPSKPARKPARKKPAAKKKTAKKRPAKKKAAKKKGAGK